jgi:predicted dehydrogenase
VHTGWGPSGWFTEAKLAGGGAVADMGIHAIDTLRFVLGEPKALAVSARTARRFISGDVEDTASIRIDWEGGTWSEVEAGWWQPYADGPESSLRLYGEGGTATLFPTAVVQGAETDKEHTLPGPVVTKADHCDPSIYAAQIAHMVAVINGAPSLLDECGPAAVAIMEAAYRSAASGKTEAVAGS